MYLVEEKDPGAGGKTSAANHEEAPMDNIRAFGARSHFQRSPLGTIPRLNGHFSALNLQDVPCLSGSLKCLSTIAIRLAYTGPQYQSWRRGEVEIEGV